LFGGVVDIVGIGVAGTADTVVGSVLVVDTVLVRDGRLVDRGKLVLAVDTVVGIVVVNSVVDRVGIVVVAGRQVGIVGG